MKKIYGRLLILFSLVAVVLITAFSISALVVPVYEGVYVGGLQGIYDIDGAAETYEGLIPYTTSTNRKAIAINPATNMAYVVDFRTTGTPTVIHFFAVDLITGNVVKTFGFTDEIAGVPNVAINTITNKIYISSSLFNTVVEIDASDYSLRKIRTLPDGPSVGFVAVNEDDNLVYVTVANSSTGRVDCIDPTTATLVASTTAATFGINPTGIAYDNVNGYVYVSCAGGNFYVLDAATLTTVATFTLNEGPGTPNLWGIAYNQATNLIYVTDYNKDVVYVVSITNSGAGDVFTRIATIPVGSGSGPRLLAIDEKTNRIYVNGYLHDTVAIIDGNTNTVVKTLFLGTDSSPGGIAIYYPTVVTFMNNDGSTSVYSEVLIGNNLPATAPATNPTNSGYEFVGWFETAVGLNPNPSLAFNFSTVLHDDKILYAGWKEPDVTLTYNPNGGINTHTIASITVRDILTVLDISATGIVRSGYSFVSWNTQANGGGTTYFPGDSITMNTNMVLYAQWQALNGPNTGAESLLPSISLMVVAAGSFIIFGKRKKRIL